jgi:hypothetical protein
VETGDHLFELGQNPVRAVRVARVGREEPDRVIAPVVDEALSQQQIVGYECVHGQELDRCHAQTLDVTDDRGRTQPRIGPAHLFGRVGIQFRVPAHVRFVDDRRLPRHGAPQTFAVPFKVLIDDNAFGNERRAVTLVE